MKKHESALIDLLQGFRRYAQAHKEDYDSPIGDDYVLGPHWEDIGKGILGLLNGETGKLDCGMVDGHIRTLLKEAGCNDE